MVYAPLPPIDENAFMKAITSLPGDVLNMMTDKLQGSHPNTYTCKLLDNLPFYYRSLVQFFCSNKVNGRADCVGLWSNFATLYSETVNSDRGLGGTVSRVGGQCLWNYR